MPIPTSLPPALHLLNTQRNVFRVLRDVVPFEDCHKDSLSTKSSRNRYTRLHRYTGSDLRHVGQSRSQGLVSQALHGAKPYRKKEIRRFRIGGNTGLVQPQP